MVAGAVGIVAATIWIGRSKLLGGSKKAKKPALPGVVYLYQLRRPHSGLTAPNVSPFCTKVEAYLRLHKIPHVIRYPLRPKSKNERFPYIEIDGEEVEDSHEIMKRLMAMTGEQPPAGDAKHRALALMRTLDLSAYHHCLRWLFVDSFNYVYNVSVAPIPKGLVRYCLLRYIRRSMINMLNSVGLGDLSEKQYHQAWLEDIEAVEAALAGNTWFEGGSAPTAVDCMLYGHIRPLVNPKKLDPKVDGVSMDPPAAVFARNSKVLIDYCRRMDDLLFPDLQELLTKKDPAAEEQQLYR